MDRKRSVSYTAFNIRTHPHSYGKYVDLFYLAFDLKREINLRGDTYGIMTQIEPLHEDPIDGLIGEVAKFTKIEAGKWFNLQKLRPAEEDETRKIIIPEELRPNFTSFSFVFYPKNHYLVVECKDKNGQMSPRLLENFFRILFDAKEIVNAFNKVELTLIPREDQLRSIFSLKKIKTLELIIRRPNTDGLEDLEDEVLERLNNQNAVEEVIILKAQQGLSIQADQQMQDLSHVAQLNGEVKASGQDEEGRRVELSTKQHPLIETGKYRPGEMTAKDFLVVMSRKIISKVRGMRRAGARNG